MMKKALKEPAVCSRIAVQIVHEKRKQWTIE